MCQYCLQYNKGYNSLLPQAVDLIREPSEDEAQDKNSSHFYRLYFGFPYQTTHLYNGKNNHQTQTKLIANCHLYLLVRNEMFQLETPKSLNKSSKMKIT